MTTGRGRDDGARRAPTRSTNPWRRIAYSPFGWRDRRRDGERRPHCVQAHFSEASRTTISPRLCLSAVSQRAGPAPGPRAHGHAAVSRLRVPADVQRSVADGDGRHTFGRVREANADTEQSQRVTLYAAVAPRHERTNAPPVGCRLALALSWRRLVESACGLQRSNRMHLDGGVLGVDPNPSLRVGLLGITRPDDFQAVDKDGELVIVLHDGDVVDLANWEGLEVS